MLFSWCCRWFFPITSPAVQELDRKVTMAEQIATMRYLMNAFMFWFIIFFCPLLSFASETTRFEAWSLVFITFLFSQLGRYFSPTGQVILRAFWITMQRYEIPICQVCDSVRYHAIAEHFLKNYQLLDFRKFCPTRPEGAEAPSPGRALKKSLYGLC